MQELLNKLTSEVGLSADQAQKSLQTIIGFVKTKLPASLADTVDNIFTGKTDVNQVLGANANTENASTSDNLMDKAKDMAGDAKETLGNLADSAKEKFSALTDSENLDALKDKAEETFDDLKDKAQDLASGAMDKLKGLFGKKD